ncbi:MAG: DNA-processing protein DprA [Thermomicrobiales bacterium]|nr:DNA-processing protein DprA [Thermomicrobiales bacterium]
MNQPIDHLERACWLAMSQIPGIGPVRAVALYQHFGNLSEAWRAPERELATVLDSRTLQQVLAGRASVDPEALLESTTRLGITVITQVDAEYPRLLAQISGAPPVLYVRGKLLPEDDTAVAFVGTRRSTAYGRHVVAKLAGDLAAAGVTVVSGLALGIDGAAHQGALERGGRTVAVLAGGVDVIYPSEHRSLAERITASGALISDYPPGTKPDAPHFPARNRLISGLSLATVVVEAPRRSGALITVNFAADQGRDVFVVPSNVDSAAGEGSNRLLRDGARAVTCAADILEDLGLAAREESEPDSPVEHLSDDERRILAVIGSEPRHMDEIVVTAGLSISQGAAIMTMLELRDLVRNVGSQHYVATRGGGRASR